MKMKKCFVFTLIILSTFLAFRAYAEVPITTGFIPGQIWYSKEPLVEGDTVKVYTAIWNGDDNSLSAQVTFYDKNVVLGTRDVVVPSSQMKDVSVSWQVTSGDHYISAKIVSSSISTDNKNEQVTLNRVSTTEDHKFVSVVLKNSDGTTASSSDIVNSQINSVSSTVNSVIPASISTPVSKSLDTLDAFRDTTYSNIDSAKKDTQKEIDSLNIKSNSVTNSTKAKTLAENNTTTASTLNQIDKPIAYVKLFFLSVISFIFGYKLVFYGLIAFFAFIIIRYLYRKIRNR
jgi:hypothetical protein